ncbi:hypothetical protein AMTRI_Chr08g206120 [Amborella trichopoda]
MMTISDGRFEDSEPELDEESGKFESKPFFFDGLIFCRGQSNIMEVNHRDQKNQETQIRVFVRERDGCFVLVFGQCLILKKVKRVIGVFVRERIERAFMLLLGKNLVPHRQI